jgi:hypothetical protein
MTIYSNVRRRRVHRDDAAQSVCSDWPLFARDELHCILLGALSSGVTNGLIRYIEANGIISKIATKAARYPITGRTCLRTVTFTSLGTSL